MKSIYEVEIYVDQFCSMHMNGEMVIVSAPYDIEKDFENEYPHGNYSGVYILTNENDQLIRIGQTGRNL